MKGQSNWKGKHHSPLYFRNCFALHITIRPIKTNADVLVGCSCGPLANFCLTFPHIHQTFYESCRLNIISVESRAGNEPEPKHFELYLLIYEWIRARAELLNELKIRFKLVLILKKKKFGLTSLDSFSI